MRQSCFHGYVDFVHLGSLSQHGGSGVVDTFLANYFSRSQLGLTDYHSLQVDDQVLVVNISLRERISLEACPVSRSAQSFVVFEAASALSMVTSTKTSETTCAFLSLGPAIPDWTALVQGDH